MCIYGITEVAHSPPLGQRFHCFRQAVQVPWDLRMEPDGSFDPWNPEMQKSDVAFSTSLEVASEASCWMLLV